MALQPITYRGHTAAAATRSRFFLAEALDQRAVSDPERTFVIFMCAYAGDALAVIGGRLGYGRDVSGRRRRGGARLVSRIWSAMSPMSSTARSTLAAFGWR